MEVFHKRHKEQEADYRHKVHQGKETLKKTSQVCEVQICEENPPNSIPFFGDVLMDGVFSKLYWLVICDKSANIFPLQTRFFAVTSLMFEDEATRDIRKYVVVGHQLLERKYVL